MSIPSVLSLVIELMGVFIGGDVGVSDGRQDVLVVSSTSESRSGSSITPSLYFANRENSELRCRWFIVAIRRDA
jgi:hypothetical protein